MPLYNPKSPWLGGQPTTPPVQPAQQPDPNTTTSQPQADIPPSQPFGALDVDKYGLPYFGTGFQGWVRKAWADLSDPSKYFQDQNKISIEQREQVKAKYEAKQTEIAGKIEKLTNWSQWGEDFFGLSAKELATMPAAGNAEREIAALAGDSVAGTVAARSARIVTDTTQNFVWGGLAVLGLSDVAMRKIWSARAGLDAVADRFNPDTEDTFIKKIFSTGSLSIGRDLFTVAEAINSGRLSWKETGEVVSSHAKGSEMAYSMIFDEYARAEFEKGLEAGRDEGMLAQELGNPWIELGGSILGDPMTYFGVNIYKPVNILSKEGRLAGDAMTFFGKEVKLFGVNQRVPWQLVTRTPEFGEIIGIGAKARIGAEKLRFVETAVPGLAETLQRAEKIAGEPQAKEMLTQAAKLMVDDARAFAPNADALRTQKQFGKLGFLNPLNFAVLDSNGKVAVTARDAGLFFDGMVKMHGIDGAIQTLQDMVNLRSADDIVAQKAAANILSRGNSAMITSEVGRMTGEIMSRLGVDDFGKMARTISDPAVLHEKLFGKLETVLHDLIPSVDEMLEAERQNKILLKAGKEVPPKTARLAEMAKDVPDIVKTINRMTRPSEFVAKKTTGAMVNLFMNLVPRSWARNIEGQAVMIGMHLGLQSAIDISVRATSGLFKKTAANDIEFLTESLVKTLGGVPKGIGGIGETSDVAELLKKTKIGMLPAVGRSEQLASLGIMEKAGRDEMRKILPRLMNGTNGQAVKEWQDVVNALPKEQQGLFYAAFHNARGNFDEAVSLFRKWTGKGEIEAWRVTSLPEQMERHLDDMHLLDTVREIQHNAVDEDDFAAKFDNLIETYRSSVMAEAVQLPSTTSAVPTELIDWAQDLAEQVGKEQRRAMTELIQGWQNTRTAMDDVSQSVTLAIHKAVVQSGNVDLENQFNALLKGVHAGDTHIEGMNDIKGMVSATYKEVNWVREKHIDRMNALKNLSREQLVKLWNKPIKYNGQDAFSLAKIYPNTELSKLDAAMFKKFAWPAFFDYSANAFRTGNVNQYEKTLAKLEEMAKLVGSSLDEIASARQDLQNPFLTLTKAHKEAMQLEEIASFQRFYRQMGDMPDDAMLSQVVGDFSELFPDFKGGKSHIMSIINKGRKDKIAYEEVTMKEVKSLFAKRFHAAPFDPQGQTAIDTRRVLKEGLDDFLDDMENFKNSVVKDWGVKVKTFAVKTPDIVDIPEAEKVNKLMSDPSQASSLLWNHRTTSASAENISKEGFKLVKPKNGWTEGKGVYLSIGEENAAADSSFGDTVIKTKININNPYVVEPSRESNDALDALVGNVSKEKLSDALKAKGYDSLIVKDGKDSFIVVFDPKNVGIAKSEGLEEKLRSLKPVWNKRFGEAQFHASVTAVATRNFILHDYNKTYLDHALTYLMGNSMHYWTTRTYMRTLETLLSSPKYATQYLRYKQFMQKEHANMPEYYRYNVEIGALPGVDMKNPYYVNLESAINPIYGLTGTDFNDPYKTVDWVSRMVNSAGQLGPSFSPLVNYAVAMHLYQKGEENAAQRWMGRMFPQSPLIKSATAAAAPMANDLMAKLGIDAKLKPVEIDPFVNFLDGGIDPYERNRVAAAFAKLVDEGVMTQEEAIDASRLKKGELWDMAVQRSAQDRATGDASSFFFGAGLRPRTQQDLKIEEFWGKYNTLLASASVTNPDEYRAAWDKLREQYSFMDALLIGRKTGEAGDTAFAYNVFGRIPPGQLNDISEVAGIQPYMIEAFYNAKGDFDAMGLNPQDKARFISGVTDLALMLEIPQGATKEEWNAAKKAYADMNKALAAQYGDDIQDRIGQFYDLRDAERQDWLEANPDVEQAMNDKTAIVANTPILNAYYGGLDTVERYHINMVYRELDKRFGSDIQNIVNEYNAILDPKESRAFYANHNLKAYFDAKRELTKQANKAIVNAGASIPAGRMYQIRPEFQALSGIQQEMLGQAQQQLPQWTDFQQILTQPLQEVVINYWQNGTDIPYSAKDKLDYIARSSGYTSADDLLRSAGLALQNTQGAAMPSAQPQPQTGGGLYNPKSPWRTNP